MHRCSMFSLCDLELSFFFRIGYSLHKDNTGESTFPLVDRSGNLVGIRGYCDHNHHSSVQDQFLQEEKHEQTQRK